MSEQQSVESDAPECRCPTIENGDVRCHVCGEYVNRRCWKCRTPRGGGACPNPHCLRCEVPIYQDPWGVWRRELTAVADCPRNPDGGGHEPLTRVTPPAE